MELLAAFENMQRSWHLLPLIVVVSLVYTASRYESQPKIIRRSIRLALTIAGFMVVVLGILVFLSRGL
jgi:hypothetical protein